MDITELEFGSFLSYSPKGDQDEQKFSRTAMSNLKNDQYVNSELMSDFIADKINAKIDKLQFSDLFSFFVVGFALRNVVGCRFRSVSYYSLYWRCACHHSCFVNWNFAMGMVISIYLFAGDLFCYHYCCRLYLRTYLIFQSA